MSRYSPTHRLVAAAAAFTTLGGAWLVALPAHATVTTDWLDQANPFTLPSTSTASVVDSQGRTLLLRANGDHTATVTRFLADGSRDGSYRGGSSDSVLLGAHDHGSIVADGDRAVVLSIQDSNLAMKITRLTDAGVVDTTFASAGKYTLPTFADAVAADLAVRPGGAPVAFIGHGDGDSYSSSLFSLTPTGTLDPAFNSGAAKAVVGLVQGIAADDTTVTTAGYDPDFVGRVTRYTAAGALDPSFSGDGSVALPQDLEVNGLTQAGGVSYVAADRYDDQGAATNAAAVVKVTAAGALDTTFGGDGIAEGPARTDDPVGTKVAVAGSSVYLTDVAYDDGSDDVVDPPLYVHEFTAAGAAETSFGDRGTLTVDQYRGIPVTGGTPLITNDGRLVLNLDLAAYSGGKATLSTTLAPVKAATVLTPGSFVGLTPTRVLDTRNGVGAAKRAVPAGGSITLDVGGVAGVPEDASAAVLNVTVVQPTAAFAVTAYPAGAPLPTASNINGKAGATTPNLVTVKLGTDGKVVLRNGSQGTVQLIADVAGFYRSGTVSAAGAFVPVTPSRLLDTRTAGGKPLAANAQVDVQVTGRGGVPAENVSAVVINLTAVTPSAIAAITAYPTGQATPTVSNLNLDPNQTRANLATVTLGEGGKIRLKNGSRGTTHLLADVAGYYLGGTPTAGGTYVALPSPQRVVDTRRTGAVKAGGSVPVAIPEVAAGFTGSAMVVNVTVTQPTGNGLVTAYPKFSRVPTASNLNYLNGQTVANLVVGKLGYGSTLNLGVSGTGSAQLLADVAGYFKD